MPRHLAIVRICASSPYPSCPCLLIGYCSTVHAPSVATFPISGPTRGGHTRHTPTFRLSTLRSWTSDSLVGASHSPPRSTKVWCPRPRHDPRSHPHIPPRAPALRLRCRAATRALPPGCILSKSLAQSRRRALGTACAALARDARGPRLWPGSARVPTDCVHRRRADRRLLRRRPRRARWRDRAQAPHAQRDFHAASRPGVGDVAALRRMHPARARTTLDHFATEMDIADVLCNPHVLPQPEAYASPD